MKDLYEYCDDCPIIFATEEQKINCGLYWRPKSGTKEGFPIDGWWNCHRDTQFVKEQIASGKTLSVTEDGCWKWSDGNDQPV